MKLVLLICVVVMALQLGTLGLGVWRGDGEAIEGSDYDPEEKIPGAGLLSRFSDFFQPEIELGWAGDERAFTSGREAVAFREGDADDPVPVGFELVSGSEVAITSNCPPMRGSSTPPKLELCGGGGSCRSSGELIVCKETGEIIVTPADPGVVVRKF